MGQYSVDINQE